MKTGKLFVACIILVGSILAGCGPGNQSADSESYKKLPPGEGERRLKDTLKRRSEGKVMDHPYGADVRVPDSK